MDLASPAVSGTSVYANGLIYHTALINNVKVHNIEFSCHRLRFSRSQILRYPLEFDYLNTKMNLHCRSIKF